MHFLPNNDLKRFKTAINSLDSSVLIEDENRIIRYVNQSLCDLFQMPLKSEQLIGVDSSLVTGMNKFLFVDEEDFIQSLNDASAGRLKSRNEKILMKNGNVLLRDYTPIFDDNKVYIGNVWNFKNLTVEFDNDKELCSQKKFYEDVLNALPVDVAVFNDDYKYVFLNKSAVKSDEIRAWLIGKDDFEYADFKGLSKDFAVQRQSAYRKAKEELINIDFEEIVERENGDQVIVLRKIKPVIEEDKSSNFVVGCGLDITQQIENDRKFHQIDSKYEYLVNRLNEVIFTIDTEGYFEFINPAWTKLTGYEVYTTKGRKLQEYFSNDEFLQQAFFNKLISIEHTIGTREYQLFAKDELVWVTIDIEQHYENNILVGYNGTITDISHQKLAEEHLLTNLQREKDLNDLKSKFVAMVSHEFRTPLAAISSSVEIMEMLGNNKVIGGDEKVKDHLSKIGMQISRMTELMNEVLLISKIESGVITPVFEQFDLLEMMEEVKSEFDYTDFKINVTSNKESFPLFADKSMMHHVMVNLTSNAIKYSQDKREIDINLFQNCNHAEITVKDYGIGIPDEDKQNLFKSFYRASNIRNIPGTGLGLLIVKHYLDLQNASITFNSQENKGTTFKVEIPNEVMSPLAN